VAAFAAWRDEVATPASAVKAVTEPVTKSAPNNDALVRNITRGIAQTLAPYLDKIDALERRVAELERNQKTYLGVWREGREYSQNSEVTFDGARWFCTKRTIDKPGCSADWVMQEKSATPRSEMAPARARQNGHYANPRPPRSP
jgi:hypothetical protein